MDSSNIIMFSFVLLIVVLLLFILFCIGIWTYNSKPCLSPYSKLPLRRAEDLSLYTKEKVLRFVLKHLDYDNRIFEFKKSSFCRETGRIFQNSITWYDTIQVDWTFLEKRYPGTYVSWGSLSLDHQREIREQHGGLEGFQTDFSCPHPAPRAITPEYALIKPGPLYVDLGTKALIGWKCVPDTEMEVLIVQKPIRKIYQI